jgi:RNA polymerase sigma factor (sigma-70 family)
MINPVKKRNLILNHLNWATNIAKRKARQYGVWFATDDIVGAAYLGLVEAAYNYQDVGPGFRTFAYIRINGQIIDEACFVRNIKRRIPKGKWLVLHANEGEEGEINFDNIFNACDDLEAIERRHDFFKALETIKLKQTEKVFINICWIQGKSMKEAGDSVGMGESRMCQIRGGLIKKLTKILTEENVKETV